jgi:hypothetical protein
MKRGISVFEIPRFIVGRGEEIERRRHEDHEAVVRQFPGLCAFNPIIKRRDSFRKSASSGRGPLRALRALRVFVVEFSA